MWMAPKAAVALLFFASVLSPSEAADSGRHLLQSSVPTSCPDNSVCPCASLTWQCSTTGVTVDATTPLDTTCPGGHFFRQRQPSCPCYDGVGDACVEVQDIDEYTVASLLTIGPFDPACFWREPLAATGCTSGGSSDPIITGFDDRKFHFNEVGNFTLLSDGTGYLVETSFVGVPPVGDVMPKETSWTNEVRIYNPHGHKITCHLPYIYPNTSTVTMTAQAAGASATIVMTPYDNNVVEFEDMSATAVSSGWPTPYVTGCHVSMPQLDLIVYQVQGSDQAKKFNSEKWAAPYTWLNIDVKLLKPLAPPVTGILGATYPVDLQDAAALDPDIDVSRLPQANVAGEDPYELRQQEPSAPAGNARRLAKAATFPLLASIEMV